MRFALLLFLVLSSYPSHTKGLSKTLNISTGQWPPYMDQASPNEGCVARLIRDAFAVSNYRVRFNFMPWDRAYHEGMKEEFIGSAYWYKSKERARYYTYTSYPLTEEVTRFYHLKELDFKYDNYEDLKPFTLVLNQGLTYPETLLEAIKKYEITTVNATYTTKNLSYLLKKRGDVVILTEQTKAAYAKELTKKQLSKITYQEKPAFILQGFLLINKRHKEYVAIFDKGIATLWEDKSYKEYYQQNCLHRKNE